MSGHSIVCPIFCDSGASIGYQSPHASLFNMNLPETERVASIIGSMTLDVKNVMLLHKIWVGVVV